MRQISFFIGCIPPKGTHQQNVRIFKGKTGRSFIGRSKTNKAARDEQSLTQLLQPHAPDQPFQGPVTLQVTWDYPYRKSEPKKNRGRPIPCDTRPDCDNLMKGLCDIMTRLAFWNDDSQVADVSFRKRWNEVPGIAISISPIQQQTL